MEDIKIITDTSSDIPKELVEKYNIGIVRFLTLFGEKEYVNGTEITNSSIALEVFETTQPDVIITLSVYSATTGETVTVYATLIQDGGSSSYTENAGGSLPVLPDDDSGTIIK